MAKTYATWPHFMCQLGRESAPGTIVPATTVWRGPYGGWQDTREIQEAVEDIGLLMSAARPYNVWQDVSIPIPETELTFEQVNHLFEAAIKTATPSGTGTYTRLYEWAIDGSAPPAIKTYTLELANTLALSDGKKIPYCFVKDFQLSGKAKQAWMMSGNWIGQRLTPLTAFTASIAKPTVEVAKFYNTKLYIDASAGTPGTTQKTGVLMGFSVKVNSGIEVIPVGDGNLYFTSLKRGRPEVNFSMTLELEEDTGVSTVAVERGHFENNATRLIRVEILGSGSKKVLIDLAARYTSVGQPQKEGTNNATVTFEGKADISTADNMFAEFTTVTTLANIP